MSDLPADVARCPGRDAPACACCTHDVHPECIDCLRRTDRSTFPLQVWTAPPVETPCPLRLPHKRGEA